MKSIISFLKNKKSIRFASVVSLFFVGVFFFIYSFFDFNIIEKIFFVDIIERIVYMIISLALFVIMYGAYSMDRVIVTTKLEALKRKISEEAKDIRDEFKKS